MTTSVDGDVVVALEGISKTFSGNRVLRSVDLRLRAGQVHGLVGMNGSGKSTLIKILAGIYRADPGGAIHFHGAGAASGEPGRRPIFRRAEPGVHMGFVHQDLGLVETLSITDNFALTLGYEMSGLGSVRRRRIAQLTEAGLSRVGLRISAEAQVSDLGAADRSLVAIARALTQLAGHERPCLVLDEPTASLPRREVDRVLDVVRALAAEGAAVMFVSHNLGEVTGLATQVTVLRDGRVVEDRPTAELTAADIVDAMLGESIERALAELAEAAEAADDVPARQLLTVRDLHGTRIEGLDLNVAHGQIVALTGLVGCGKSEAGRILAGSSAPVSGSMQLEGTPYSPGSPRAAMTAGVSYVPAERLRRGGILEFTAQENITLPVLGRFWRRVLVNGAAERTAAEDMIARTRVRPADRQQMFGLFSGGNQQKIVLARALVSDPKLLIVDEPTQGVDVGAIPVLYECIRDVAAAGAGVILISSSYEEVAELADEAVVLDRGRVYARLSGTQITVANLVASNFDAATREQQPTTVRTT